MTRQHKSEINGVEYFSLVVAATEIDVVREKQRPEVSEGDHHERQQS